MNLALNCLAFVLFGYSAYTMILIRAKAKPAVSISNPDNMFSFYRYLIREQYGSTPLLYGNYFDSEAVGITEGATLYRPGEDRYVPAGRESDYEFDRATILPRIYSKRPGHPEAYRSWLGLRDGENPTFADNFKFFTAYQAGFMYMRYFLWNFAGKQNDNQGQGELVNGNWITGVKPIDAVRLGNQDHLPQSITENKGYNRFYALPLILGIAGLLYQYRRNKKDAALLVTLFFCTGLAIVLYLNMDPMQVRERDYIFAGSFYVFAIWIGMGVLGVRELLARVTSRQVALAASFGVCAAAVPFLMGKEGWDDHDRSGRFTARDMAANYLNSCAPNAILFTDADNDTYPLWYAQQVEGIRRDVRVINMELLYDPSTINQLKNKLFDSAPVPVTMAEEKYAKGVRDDIPYVDYGLTDSVELQDLLEVMISDNPADQADLRDGSKTNFLPSKSWKLSINAADVVASGTVSRKDLHRITPKMEWTYNKDHVTRADLAMVDILAHNQWKRPVYFTTGLGKASYMGLDKYLYMEGYAYRLLPLRRDANDTRDKTSNANASVMAGNLLHKFSYSFKNAAYLDPESRHIANMTWGAFNNLAENLLLRGDSKASKAVMDKAMRELPLNSCTSTDTINKYAAAVNYYRLNETGKASGLLSSAVSFLDSELGYYASLDEDRQRRNAEGIGEAVSILQACRELAFRYDQPAIVNEVDRAYTKAEKNLVFAIRG